MLPIDFYSPAEIFLRCFALLLYIPVGIVVVRRVFPRLSLFSKRLTIGLLVVQILVQSVSLVFHSTSDFWIWLWSLNREGNIPALVASAQYVLASAVALLAAWNCSPRMSWQRVYLAVVGFLMVFLTLDESLELHEKYRDLFVLYLMLGPVLLALSTVAAAHSAKKNRILHICLVAGLAIAGFGEIVVEHFKRVHVCGSVGFIELSRCLEPYFLEEPLGFLGIWLVLVAALGHLTSLEPSPRRRVRLSLYVIPMIWMLIVFLALPIHQPVPPSWAQPASVVFESGTQINAYHIDEETKQVSVIMYFPVGLDITDIGYSLHVIDQISMKSVDSHNKYVRRKYRKVSILHKDFRPLYEQKIALNVPADTPTNHALGVVLTLWRDAENGFGRLKILSSDLSLLDDTQVLLGEFALRDIQPSSSTVLLGAFDNGFVLEGFGLPNSASAGDNLNVAFSWRSDEDSKEDHVQFLHLGHEASGEWWVYDQPPLGARLPTRLWYGGLADSAVWQVPLPSDLAPGTYKVLTGLYRVRDKERIPVTDADGRPWSDARILLGTVSITS